MPVHALVARTDGAQLARIEVDSAGVILEFRPNVFRISDARLIRISQGWHADGGSTLPALHVYLAEHHGTEFELRQLGEA